MSDAPSNVSALIGRWPSIVEFSSDVGCGYEAARQMRRRERIAPEHWPNVISAAAAKGISGITLDWLTQQRIGATADERQNGVAAASCPVPSSADAAPGAVR